MADEASPWSQRIDTSRAFSTPEIIRNDIGDPEA
jgi:hypothetical protein